MTTTPFEPRPESGEQHIAAADPGRGGPPPAPGFGVHGEEPDLTEESGETREEGEQADPDSS